MSLRSAPAVAMLLGAVMLGGCARNVIGDGGHASYFPGDGQPAAAPVSIAEPVVRHGHTAPSRQGAWSEPQVVMATASAGGYVGHATEEAATAGDPHRPYRLDSGDRLRVFVYGQPNLSRIYPVDQAGRIAVPLIGTLKARGLTTSQLAGAIRARLGASFVRDPQVSVDIAQYRPFFILGEVRSPGQYPYVEGMTVETAVAIAGGYGERASERRMRLKRRTGGVSETIEAEPDFEVEPGDSIYVRERFF